uniref:Uncharacterized protein n=1 Tax=Arundo donax TaxID=35708 RepID=A0A0A9AGT9_ARUDO
MCLLFAKVPDPHLLIPRVPLSIPLEPPLLVPLAPPPLLSRPYRAAAAAGLIAEQNRSCSS